MRFASVFSSGMVLQQGMPLPIWGSALPESTVVVTFAGQESTATTNSEGRWLLHLNPLTANSEPSTLTASCSDGTTITLDNILVGEVWICSGQSNMAMTMTGILRSEEEIAAAVFPAIRLLNVPRRQSAKPEAEMTAAWEICSPETVASFSAVAYFFGRELHRTLNVPIGLISTSWGGTPAEAWTSREGFQDEPKIRDILTRFDHDILHFEQAHEDWKNAIAAEQVRTRDVENRGFEWGWAAEAEPSGTWSDMTLPGTWQGHGCNHSGIFWFRKTVDLPDAWAGRDLRLSIGATDKSDVTYFNNEKIGSVTMTDRDDAWEVPRVYTVSGRLVKKGRNVIAVRVHSENYYGGMTGPAHVMTLAPVTKNDDDTSMNTCAETDAGSGAALSLAGTWRYAIEANYGLVTLPSEPLRADHPYAPTALFNGMIAPLIPLAIRGAIWYQGEANVDRPILYRDLFPAMIRNWRRMWGQGDFDFHFVQLANFTAKSLAPAESHWSLLREAQSMALSLPHTSMAVTIDIGETNDIHPRNKQDVGLRLAANALHHTYQQHDMVPCGPLFRKACREGATFRMTFDYVGGGLVSRGETLVGFAIAGVDRRFVWADAIIEGDEVIVSSSSVSSPEAVRYGWGNNPDVGLYNAEGFPAAPFRTDDW